MARFDLEDFRDVLKAYLVDGMTAKVSEINTEKGDSLLIDIPEAQYFQDFNEKIVNFKEFIYFGFQPFEAGISSGDSLAQPVSMFFVTMVTDQSGGIIGENKILRYTRAMTEIFQAKALSDSRISDLEITILPPDLVKIEPGSEWYKAGGVNVKGTVLL